jgi:hypothetical protein
LKIKDVDPGCDFSSNHTFVFPVTSWLNGNNNPKIETVEMISSALGIEVWQLFTSSDTPTPGKMLNGFVEYQGTVHRSRTVDDLDNLLELIKKER